MQIHNLGLRPYQEIWDAMRACTAARDADSADQIWLVQHPPVYTQGQANRNTYWRRETSPSSR